MVIDSETFARVAQRRYARAPAQVPPRVVTSPTLLTGLLKCGACGAGMTLATGKGGRYRYYKCNRRIGQGKQYCSGRAVPMAKLDSAVLHALADKVLTPARVKVMLAELERRLKASRSVEDEALRGLARELDTLTLAANRLYEAVEQGVLPLDASLQERVRKQQARRQEILIEMAGLRRRGGLPLQNLRPGHIDAFARVVRAKLLTNSGFAKQYLRLLVSVIRLDGHELRITGSYAALAHAVGQSKKGAPDGVPTFASNWLPDQGSNLGPAD